MNPAILTETVLTLAEAATAAPKVGGKGPSERTVRGWADVGIRVQGVPVRLETAKVGGRRVTSREALARFFERTSEQVVVVLPPTPTQRRKESEAAVARLRDRWAKK